MSLGGKVAVVTGGASGIGRAISLRLGKDGAAVSVWDFNKAGADETAKLIEDAGGKAIACAVDVTKAAQIDAAVTETRGALGPVLILVNNAALGPFHSFKEITEELWDRVMAVNLKGPFLCTQAVIDDMLAARWGRIVNVSSSSAQSGAVRMSHYVASKGGVVSFTKALALEFAGAGITVNTIPPAFIDTPMLRASPVNIDSFAAKTPMKRAGAPEDVAAACAYLVSEEAGYVTGHSLIVSGGTYML